MPSRLARLCPAADRGLAVPAVSALRGRSTTESASLSRRSLAGIWTARDEAVNVAGLLRCERSSLVCGHAVTLPRHAANSRAHGHGLTRQGGPLTEPRAAILRQINAERQAAHDEDAEKAEPLRMTVDEMYQAASDAMRGQA